jgi:hypothetical protein
MYLIQVHRVPLVQINEKLKILFQLVIQLMLNKNMKHSKQNKKEHEHQKLNLVVLLT